MIHADLSPSLSLCLRYIGRRGYLVSALKATNTNAPDLSDKRTSAELISIIETAQVEIAEGLAKLKS